MYVLRERFLYFLTNSSQSWLIVFDSCCQLRVTHHTSCLYGLRHVPSVGLTPEDVTVKTMAASVHDEGERVHVAPDAHERQESNTTLHQHVLFVLLRNIPVFFFRI